MNKARNLISLFSIIVIGVTVVSGVMIGLYTDSGKNTSQIIIEEIEDPVAIISGDIESSTRNGLKFALQDVTGGLYSMLVKEMGGTLYVSEYTFYGLFYLVNLQDIVFTNCTFNISPINQEFFMNYLMRLTNCNNISFINCGFKSRIAEEYTYSSLYIVGVIDSNLISFTNCSFSQNMQYSTDPADKRVVLVDMFGSTNCFFYHCDLTEASNTFVISYCDNIYIVNNTIVSMYLEARSEESYLHASFSNIAFYWNKIMKSTPILGAQLVQSNVSFYHVYNGYPLGNYYSDYCERYYPESFNGFTYITPYEAEILDAYAYNEQYSNSINVSDTYPLITYNVFIDTDIYVTSPLDIRYFINDIENYYIYWYPITSVFDGPTNYNITVNGEYVGGHYNKRWYSDQLITLNVSRFPYGNHSIILRLSNGFTTLVDEVFVNVSYPFFYNDKPNIVPDEFIEPIEENGDYTFLSWWSTDPSQKILQWQLKDAISGDFPTYNLSLNLLNNTITGYDNVSWESGDFVSLDITDIDVGIHLYILSVDDGYGKTNRYDVIVWKYDAESENIQPRFAGQLPSDLFFYENGELNFTLKWYMIDDANEDGRPYSVYKSSTGVDGEYTVVKTGYWGNTVPATFDIDGVHRQVGDFWYYVNVSDGIASPIISPKVYVKIDHLDENTDPAFVYTPQPYYLFYDTEPVKDVTFKIVDLTTNNPYYKLYYHLQGEDISDPWHEYATLLWSHNIPFIIDFNVYLAQLQVDYGYIPFGLHSFQLNASDGFYRNLTFSFQVAFRENLPLQVVQKPYRNPEVIIYDTEVLQALKWQIIDTSVRDQKYSVVRNGSQQVNTTWYSGIPIQFAVSTSTYYIGANYSIEFYANDGVGFSYSEAFTFRKEFNVAPVITDKFDFSTVILFDSNYARFTLGQIIDNSSRYGYYTLLLDGRLVRYEFWKTEDFIELYINRLSQGNHTILLTINDGVGLIHTESWNIFIRSPTPTDPINPLDPKSWGWIGWSVVGASSVGVVFLIRWRLSLSKQIIDSRLLVERDLLQQEQLRISEGSSYLQEQVTRSIFE